MEKDDEWKGEGNSYDFGARMYDSRIGRWNSIDAHASSYSDISPYSSMGGNPILFVDEEGNDIIIWSRRPDTGEFVPAMVIVDNHHCNADIYTSSFLPSMDVVTMRPDDTPFPIIIEPNWSDLPDAYMASGSFSVTIGGGLAASWDAVVIFSGDDQGVFFYGPEHLEVSVGGSVGAGAGSGPVDFNEETGLELNRRTFEGRSQVFEIAF